MAKDTDKTPTVQDEQRAKFEAALEAKKHKTGHGSADHGSGGSGAVHEHSSREGGKREFRRKSGG